MTAPETKRDHSAVLPYSRIVGHARLKLALEISHVAPEVGGLLITGERGTAKSTIVRAFSRMITGRFPVTLPIGATDDRVLGGWQMDALMQGKAKPMRGLVEEAGGEGGSGMLYIDEVNLLDDHLVNIILDVASSGVLTVQRESRDETIPVNFILVGTMNPEEGWLRPQLLDRFGLLVPIEPNRDANTRAEILRAVLAFDAVVRANGGAAVMVADDERRRAELEFAKQQLEIMALEDPIYELAGRVAAAFGIEGHRGELVMLRAARALAAIQGLKVVTAEHLIEVAPMAMVHRRAVGESGTVQSWSEADTKLLEETVAARG